LRQTDSASQFHRLLGMFKTLSGKTEEVQDVDPKERVKTLSQLSVELQGGKVVDFPGSCEIAELELPDVAWDVSGYRCVGTLLLTNYRAVLIPGTHVPGITDLRMNLEMPWGVIEAVTIARSAISLRQPTVGSTSSRQQLDVLEIQCRDFRKVRVCSLTKGSLSTLQDKMMQVRAQALQSKLSEIFVAQVGATAGWTLFSWEQEFARQALPKDRWKRSDVNIRYELCETYPEIWWVPSGVLDQLVRKAAGFRSKKRAPVLTWRHPDTGSVLLRCSQPHQGSTAEKDDAEYLEAVRQAVGPNARLIFLDCRSGAAATANAWNSGGTERTEAYAWTPNTSSFTQHPTITATMLQMEIDNIHVMRTSWEALVKLIEGSVSESNWLVALHETKWLDHCRRVTEAARTAARCLHHHGNASEKSVVVVHCSDGWDRTSQICSLAQLLLDPYYRTPEGFCVLIEKDWVSFGHMFHTRVSGEKATGRSPIFLQWLFCVAAIQAQFPEDFLFSREDLDVLVDLWLSGWTGSMQRNTEQECSNDASEQVSIWAVWLRSLQSKAGRPSLWKKASAAIRGQFQAPVKADQNEVHLLRPITSLKRFELWPWVFRFDEVELAPLRMEYLSSLQHLLLWPPQKVLWVADGSASECTFCGRDFGCLRRRHHCRACGRLYCATSTCLSKAKIPGGLGYGERDVHVCTACSELSRTAAAASSFFTSSSSGSILMPRPSGGGSVPSSRTPLVAQ